jgi:CRP-like cAMP-binding protein
MLTIEDVRAVPLFSALPDAELDRLAKTSADLHLGAGEFAVHEGGERALYAVLSGQIEVVKLIDGIEKTFACGDVRLSPVKRVAAAVEEGGMAIAFVHKYPQQAGQ